MVYHGLYMVISWSTMFLKHGRPCLKHGQPCFDRVHFTGVETKSESLLKETLEVMSNCSYVLSNFDIANDKYLRQIPRNIIF